MEHAKTPEPTTAAFDTWRAANALIQHYGAQAWLISARRADTLLSEGDINGRRAWMAVHKAVGELLRSTLARGERRH